MTVYYIISLIYFVIALCDNKLFIYLQYGTVKAICMAEYEFFMKRVMRGEDGNETVSEEKNLEVDFPGLKYNAFEGLNAYGKPKNVYTEEYAERDKASVYVSPNPTYDQTTLKLKLYFFDSDGQTTDSESYDAIDEVYHSFVEFISGCKIIYRDTARKRKVMMVLEDATTPDADRIYGIPYKSVTFTFKNIYGRSFPITDQTF